MRISNEIADRTKAIQEHRDKMSRTTTTAWPISPRTTAPTLSRITPPPGEAVTNYLPLARHDATTTTACPRPAITDANAGQRTSADADEGG